MPTKNDSKAKSTYVDHLGILKGVRISFTGGVEDDFAFAYVQLPDGKLISGICDVSLMSAQRGTEVVASYNEKEKNWRVCA